MYTNGARLFPYIHSIEDDVEQQKLLAGLRMIWDYCFPLLLAMADKCDPEVWYALGDAYSHGRGTHRDRDEEIKWFERAAEAGHSHAMVRLGLRLRFPESAAGISAAIEWFRKAAARGNTGGMINLGFTYRDGHGVPVDDQEAARWFEMAANAGDRHAMILAGRVYAYQLKCPERALRWFLLAAEAHFTESYIELALLYNNRKSSVYSPSAAARWYHAAAELDRGDGARAMLALARLYRDGIGVSRGRLLARMCLQRVLIAASKSSTVHKKAAKMLKEMEGELL